MISLICGIYKTKQNKNKHNNKNLIGKEVRLVVTRIPEAEGGVRGNGRQVIKRYKLPVTILISTGDIIYNMMTIVSPGCDI